MKITSFITGIAFLGLNALASTTPETTPMTPTSPTPAPCPTACPAGTDCDTSMPAPSMTDTGAVQGFGQEWLNLDTITLEAANGNPIAQYTLAYLTDNAAQSPQGKLRAAAMYAAAHPGLEAAAAKGNPAACRALAHMCMNGKGCTVDKEKAKKLMKKCKECCTPACPSTSTPATTPPTTPQP